MKKYKRDNLKKMKDINLLDRAPFGIELIELVADKLGKGYELCYSHRDYCGHGLRCCNEKYELYECDDYQIFLKMEWLTKKDFIDFFSVQSDYSLSGADKSIKELYENDPFYLNNQRITRERLLDFATYK